MAEKIKNVISVCALKDIKVWSLSNIYIIRNIESIKYTLIVPDDEIEEFRKVTSSKFNIIGELSIAGDIKEYLIKKLPKENSHRFGWYFQQLIKLSALSLEEGGGVILIWDADTVPLRRLNFFSENGSLIHYAGKENHRPYFENITRLLKIKKTNDYSFIAQCLALRADWGVEFFRRITELHNKNWKIALIDTIDFNQASGFSEYEALGTFISNNFPNDIERTHNRWIRHGNKLIGGIENLEAPSSMRKLSPFDFASFEWWDGDKLIFKRGWAKMIECARYLSALGQRVSK